MFEGNYRFLCNSCFFHVFRCVGCVATFMVLLGVEMAGTYAGCNMIVQMLII